jgi:molecular chaperone GrpE (heat shock protein)
MNESYMPEPGQETGSGPAREPMTQGMSSLYKLFEAFITLREKNERQHRLFEQSLAKARDNLQDSFNSFAAATQGAYQQLRREMNGEKRAALSLFNELLEISLDLEHIVAARPELAQAGEESEALRRWTEAVEVECRKVQAALRRHGIHPYDAVIGSPYNPALHERVGSKRMEGMDALRVAEQKEHGFASQQPEFVLRRPKVIVSE